VAAVDGQCSDRIRRFLVSTLAYAVVATFAAALAQAQPLG